MPGVQQATWMVLKRTVPVGAVAVRQNSAGQNSRRILQG
jgi:hypothetical protein